MKNENGTGLSDQCSQLLSQLPAITRLDDLAVLATSVLRASLFLCDARGNLLASDDGGYTVCSSYREVLTDGHLHTEHMKTILSEAPTCNVVRDERCVGKACTRMSYPLDLGDGGRPGAVVYFLWDHEATFEVQCLASILTGAFSNLFRQGLSEQPDTGRDIPRLLHELMNYKPGLKNYYLTALKNAGLAEPEGHYHLAVITAREGELLDRGETLDALQALLPRAWCFEQANGLVVVHNVTAMTEADFAAILTPFLEEHTLRACYSIGFEDLLRLRYICDSTFVSLRVAAMDEPETCFYYASRYLLLTFLYKFRDRIPEEEFCPDAFLRLLEHDKKYGRDYLTTLAAYLDNGRNANAAAKQIYAHRNTVMQQLERIEQILGVSLDDNEVALYLQLCIHMHRLEQMRQKPQPPDCEDEAAR